MMRRLLITLAAVCSALLSPEVRAERRPSEILAEMEEKGLVRRATEADIADWADGAREHSPKVKGPGDVVTTEMQVGRTWVVLDRIRLPKGMHGSNRQFFIVPKGVPRPKGKLGHGTLYLHDSYTCEGAISCYRVTHDPSLELDALVESGHLRPAEESDIEPWKAKARQTDPRLIGSPHEVLTMKFRSCRQRYVVLKAVTLPKGLDWRRCFIVSEGVSRPAGDHSRTPIYDLNTGTCSPRSCMTIKEKSSIDWGSKTVKSDADLVLRFSCANPSRVEIVGGTKLPGDLAPLAGMKIGTCCAKLEKKNRSRVVTALLSYEPKASVTIELSPDHELLRRAYAACVRDDYTIGYLIEPTAMRERRLPRRPRR